MTDRCVTRPSLLGFQNHRRQWSFPLSFFVLFSLSISVCLYLPSSPLLFLSYFLYLPVSISPSPSLRPHLSPRTSLSLCLSLSPPPPLLSSSISPSISPFSSCVWIRLGICVCACKCLCVFVYVPLSTKAALEADAISIQMEMQAIHTRDYYSCSKEVDLNSGLCVLCWLQTIVGESESWFGNHSWAQIKHGILSSLLLREVLLACG